MTKQEAVDKLRELAKNTDWESAHYEADLILCDLLSELGYQDVVDAWDDIGKWYA